MAEKIILGKNGQWGVKENGLLAYNDEDNVFKAIEMDFSRSSTATRESSAGLITDSPIDTPRIDFTDGGALLLEPESRNLCDVSKVDAYSGSGTIVRTLNSGVGVTGLNDAVKLEKGSASAEYLNLRVASTTLSATTDYAHSVFVKRDDVDFDFRLEHNISTNYGFSWNVDFTITDSGVTINSEANATGKVKAYSNGWYRVSAVVTTSSPTTAITSYLFRLKASNGIGASIFIQDHQIEQQSYPTSYIPTSGATATRIAESCSKSGLENYINSSEGVLYVEMRALANDGTDRVITLNDGTSNMRVTLFYSSTDNRISFNVVNGSGVVTLLNYDLTNALSYSKIACKYKDSDYALWVNGVEVASGFLIAGTPTVGLNSLIFNVGNGSFPLYGKVKDVRVYNQALTDSELQQLTS